MADNENTDATDTTTAATTLTNGTVTVTPTTATTATATGKDGTPFDPERAQATIEKLRAENREQAKAAKRATELEARLKEIEDGQRTDAEKLAAKVTEYEQRETQWAAEKKQTNLRLALHELKDELGIASPSLALRALDTDELDWDNDTPRNLRDVVAALLEREPILKGTPGVKRTPGTQGGDGTGGPKPPALTAAELEAAKAVDMTPERYEAMKTVSTFEEFQKVRAAEKAASGHQ